jgi:hypothetical protein
MAENRGGPRSPTPGRTYSNRTDLGKQPASAPPGLEYGARKRLMDAQRVQPVAGSPSGAMASRGGPPLATRLAPGEVPSLDAPSAYPDEPVTAGLVAGAGPGPESLTVGAFGPESLSLLRLVYANFPDEDIRRLIEQTEANL